MTLQITTFMDQDQAYVASFMNDFWEELNTDKMRKKIDVSKVEAFLTDEIVRYLNRVKDVMENLPDLDKLTQARLISKLKQRFVDRSYFRTKLQLNEDIPKDYKLKVYQMFRACIIFSLRESLKVQDKGVFYNIDDRVLELVHISPKNPNLKRKMEVLYK